MKWLFGVLLLCNVGLFLWATGHKPDMTDLIRPPVNGETMMLLSEMTPMNVTGTTPSEKATEAATEKGAPTAERTVAEIIDQAETGDGGESVEQVVAKQVPPPLCLRVGPFFEEKLAGETAGRLRTLSLVVDLRKVKAREIRAYRVYLGPFDSKTEVAEQRKLLTGKGIRDFYVKREEGEKDIISLGLFTQRTGVEALTEQLKEKDVAVQVRSEDRKLDPTFWLELTDSKANRDNQAELVAHKAWGDKRTKLTEFPCS